MRKRADQRLLELGLAPTRAKAQALILAGQVYSGDRRVEKPGVPLPVDAPLSVRSSGCPFVSRGGQKLEGAILALDLDVTGACVVDVGASTGGFTDCLLSRRVAKVYAVDVGRGQLAQKLRLDPRVIVMEQTNARYLTASDFQDLIDLVVMDASFIGFGKLLPAVTSFLRPGGKLLVLVKPQFEAGRAAVSRGKGVVRDPALREEILGQARQTLVSTGFCLLGECDSPLPGPKGNVERFILARLGGPPEKSGVDAPPVP